jgi:bifunctional UDP-N-acetylglucosamine pyrophosphorylase/glucosamine-1-phosphate N-acetyltransferase
MKSNLPKVLHPLAGKPLLMHPVAAAKSLGAAKIVVVIGHGAEQIRANCASADLTWAFQEKQLGTGHAVLCTRDELRQFSGDIVILSGDVPLIDKCTLAAMLDRHRTDGAALTLLTGILPRPTGYGRVLRNTSGELCGIVEEKDATASQKEIHEFNAGVYVASSDFLFDGLEQISNNNQQREYYLPDIAAVGIRQGKKVATFQIADARNVMGINTREELARMEKMLQERINRKWLESGVTLKDPETTYIDQDVTIGKDTVIGPNTQLRGRTVIGERCQIDGSAFLTDAEVADEVHLRFSVVLTGCRIGSGAIIGPFAHLRPGSALGARVHIGNFVETKEAVIGEGSKANHLTYLGDVTVGRDSNIGAGTITCNYDGFHKYKTRIGDRVQVGSDSTLVAPIALGDDVYVATATTIRHDIPSGALVFNDRREQVREGWTEKKREQMRAKSKK